MIKVSLTRFLDFVLKSGMQKMTCLKSIKKQYDKEYEKGGDYYRLLREKVIDTFKSGKDIQEIDTVLSSVKLPHKLHNYSKCIEGIKKIVKNKKISWCGLVKGEWVYRGLSVIINPELCLDINGKTYAVKLYFKTENISKRRTECILHLIQVVLRNNNLNYTPAIFDCRAGVFISKSKDVDLVDVMLMGEVESFVTMWPQI